MVNVEMSRKRFVVLCAAVMLVALAITVPAYAFYYVHGDDYGVESDTKGSIEVFCTIDTRALGGTDDTEWSGLFFVPADSTPAIALDEAMHMNNSHAGVEGLHDYSFTSFNDFIGQKGGKWTVTVYHAESQKPGTHTTEDDRYSEGVELSLDELDSINLERFDRVVAKLQA